MPLFCAFLRIYGILIFHIFGILFLAPSTYVEPTHFSSPHQTHFHPQLSLTVHLFSRLHLKPAHVCVVILYNMEIILCHLTMLL